MLRRTILAAAGSRALERAVRTAPPTRAVVRRFVAGDTDDDAVATARRLLADSLAVSLDRLGEHTSTREHAAATAKAYVGLLEHLAAEGFADGVEVSLKLSALGQVLDAGLALEHARLVCAAAQTAGTTVTVDMEDSSTTTATLRAVAELRADFPWVGAVLQAYLRRTEDDARALAGPGSRVRLCKGAYREPADVAYTAGADVDASYARCLQVLMAGEGYPMVATHDPRLIALAGRLAAETGRGSDRYEHQLLFGVRPDEQQRLAAAGRRVRVYVPYGEEWYPYLMRRLAERPANLAFFLRALGSRG